ncbi:constitutive coactivator of peroxisome proliferator-activated receptor gamma-like [Uloborus diversus]|uniref:constitutive coactivator of peroxisome proliferator-activated receptor gamma-like n=1 Tax=Uloborus diversus TaxID=327109 RepID=UPI00240A2402|nr:constitutive coactivator of peroxisome proliferator-activated receptor gamma-like [Uloborus diversus]
MGVKGLQYFIEHECPDACKKVNIEELAHIHRRENNCDPVLVIDGSALIYPLYSTTLEWIYGGQWTQFVHKLKCFIERFRAIGVKIVFFFDGTVCGTKRKEWVKRRISKYRQISSIFNAIKRHNFVPDKKQFQLPTSMGTITRFALKEMGAEVYQTDREADEVIANYAASNRNVFGILSQDSDFIIFNTKPYLSVTHLNIDTLETVLYDRNHLAFHYLKINVYQLPLFACLIGNDIVPAERLYHFHQKLSRRQGIRTTIRDVSNPLVSLIQRERWSGDYGNKAELDNISWRVFGDSQWSWLIHNGLKSYAIGQLSSSPKLSMNMHPEFESAVYQKHMNCINGPFIFNLLCNREYESSEVLEDSSWLPTALKYRSIRQRCYGLLFNCFVSSDNHNSFLSHPRDVLINEWCAYEGNFMERPESIEPLPLQNINRVPSIDQLWFSCTEKEKLWIFWSVFQAPLQFELLLSLPKHLVVPTCILNYLIGTSEESSELQAWEVAVFIGQALLNKNAEHLSHLKAPEIDATAVHLASLFMRGVTTAMMVLGTCGYPFEVYNTMPWNFFDGKLFHHLYIKTRRNPNISQLFESQESCKEQFYHLLPVITNNTLYDVRRFNWRLVFNDF